MMRALIVAMACVIARDASGQGTVGGQGFGYPVTQQSARAAGSAGALAPFDQVSPVNPAELALWQRTVLFTHFEPEYRSSSIADAEVSTRLARFPLTGAAARLGSRGAIGVSFSTYLDRTWETAAVTRNVVGEREVDVTTRYASDGAINDVRVAGAWAFSDRLRAGAGYHVYTGGNRMSIAWDFPETEPFGDVEQSSTLSYGGSAVSLGVTWRALRHINVAAQQRFGGSARVRVGDTLITKGEMPNHTGLAVQYDGIAGTLLAASWERIGWTAMRGLGSQDLRVRDADRISVGLETGGPRVASSLVALRLGFAQRTLPFDAAGSKVTERLFAFGAGYPFARGRGSANLALQRAHRDAGDARERAWLIALGFTITP